MQAQNPDGKNDPHFESAKFIKTLQRFKLKNYCVKFIKKNLC